MRAAGLIVGLAFVMLVAYLLLFRQPPAFREPPVAIGGRWQVHHYAEAGHTIVAVARLTPDGAVVEQHVVARVDDADPSWSAQFLTAKQEAEERAFHLNTEP